MFQLVGGFLALIAVLSVLLGAPFVGAIFALLTFVWVVVVDPDFGRPRRNDARTAIIYVGRFGR
jgi:hypothetical protein